MPSTKAAPPPAEQWIAVASATTLVGFAVSSLIFLYMNFVTRTAFTEYKEVQIQNSVYLDKRLDRMESKIDLLLERPNLGK